MSGIARKDETAEDLYLQEGKHPMIHLKNLILILYVQSVV